jgi:glycosyltransferase involved in cell wall biosynthesis
MAYEVALRGKHFTAVSNDAARHFQQYFNPQAKITVIPNGLQDAIFEIEAEPCQKRSGEIVFATILQGWSRRKNATAALRAFKIVRNEIPDAQLQMYGADYEWNGKAHQWAAQRSLDAGVSFIGALQYGELLKRVKNEVDIIVHPSRDESFCMTAAEGMALKKVVIAGEVTPGVREVLGFGDSGLLTDVTNSHKLAQAMTRVAGDSKYRDGTVQRAFTRAWSLYRMAEMMGKYENLYSRMSPN